MPQLVITSGPRRLSLALVVLSAAVLGSARPIDIPDRYTPPAETPDLILPARALAWATADNTRSPS
ncbi:hypothetical protein EZI54_04665 [Marinobacter halodurans]|uniref:Uncharacterized protein n=1 Tax=Marinobacter halodurans TaxID=2528979 RepID=A0ABY1ZR60_9GAMM|nr:hypothetical protein EZI54_04665 [Marinobacter halodurans]